MSQYISCHPRLPYAAKVSIAEGERQTFHDEHRRKECLTEKQELWKILERILLSVEDEHIHNASRKPWENPTEWNSPQNDSLSKIHRKILFFLGEGHLYLSI